MSEKNIPSENSKKEILNSKQEEVTKNISQQETIEQTQNTKLETENMEVHHHPHVEKKNFKEYFLEFLMIFLAVTMGFIAENIREDITDHQRAKTFTESMIEDLKADTTQLVTYNWYYTYAAGKIDTLLNLLSSKDIDKIPSGKLYWYGLFCGAHGSFVPNDATFQQMKNSGAIELFKTQTAIDVEKYDRFCRLLQRIEQMNDNIYTEVRKVRAQIFQFKYNEMANQVFQQNRKAFSQSAIDSFIASNPPLLSNDKILFNQLAELVRSRFIRNYNVAYSDSLLKQANVLLDELHKE
jgi:hypothetical protein